MLNISPSKEELAHLEKIAVTELNLRGYDINTPVYQEGKEELMKMQLKLYTKNLMNEYASNLDREIYCHPEKLPNSDEEKALEIETDKRYKNFLKEQGARYEKTQIQKSGSNCKN
jgi:uncharacterized protein (DUF488 family)